MWINYVLLLLVIGYCGSIVHFVYLRRVDSIWPYHVNTFNICMSGFFEIVAICIELSFTLFAFQYFKSTHVIKMI